MPVWCLEYPVSLILLLMSVQALQGRWRMHDLFCRQPPWVRRPVYVAVTLTIMNLGGSEESPFIYFQF